jgi:phosphinothricin acetyltransferase
MSFDIRPMTAKDWPSVRDIYREGIASGNATFETEAPSRERWDQSHAQECRLVALQDGTLAGWAALSKVSSRCVYTGVAEVSVYVAQAAQGKGIGKALLQALVEQSEHAGIWTLQAGIFPENKASITIHKANGFREVGVRQRLGKMGGRWRDVLLLERRSSTVGV